MVYIIIEKQNQTDYNNFKIVSPVVLVVLPQLVLFYGKEITDNNFHCYSSIETKSTTLNNNNISVFPHKS